MAETFIALERASRSGRAWLEAAIWPAFVAGFAGLLCLGVAHGHMELTYAALPALGYAVLLLLEWRIPLADHGGSLRDPRLWKDLGHNVIANGVGLPLGDVLFVSVAAGLAGWISQSFSGNLWPVHWPFAAQALAALLLADGLEYWRHRAFHTVTWLWPVHVVHHDVDRLHAFKGGRTHALDMAARSLVVFAPLVALGAPGELMWLYPAALGILGPISHSNVAIRLPGWVHRVLVTPHEHYVHHARDPRLAHSNFAAFFPAWDILFGTYEQPEDHDRPIPGVPPEECIDDAFTGQLLWPFRVWRRMRGA